MDIGTTLQFSAFPRSGTITLTITSTFASSNTAVLTIANNGLACAGSWDSLTAPVVCTPGPSGVSLVTASAGGVTSPPTTVYVHQHIENIAITPVNPPSTPCYSQNQTQIYQAVAFGLGSDPTKPLDITNTVGPLTWTQGSGTVAKLNSTLTTLLFNQVQANASQPGLTTLTASAAGVSSPSLVFETCPVQQITLQVEGGPGPTFSLAKGGAKTITPTVVDTQGVTLTGVTLTWTSSQPAAVSVSNSGGISGPLVGGGDVIATCTPPTCNSSNGMSASCALPNCIPPLPVYADTAIAVTVTPTGSTGTQTTNAFVTSTGCSTNFGCTTNLVPIAVPANTVGNSAILPNAPNSMVFNRQGNKLYLGSRTGLMTVDPSASPPTVTPVNSVTGKVLAVSPNGNLVVVSDTTTTPNQVFIFNQSTTSSPVSFQITGATAAAFSPDNLKAYILAGSTLYVYSTVEALKTIPLASAANDVTFLPLGAYAFLAGGENSAVTVRDTCTNGGTFSTALPTQGTPTAVRALVDGTSFLVLDSPGIDILTASTTGSACVPPFAMNSPSVKGFVNLGQGQFTPLQFLVSTDGTKAYILTSNLGSVLVYDTAAQTSSAIPLLGNVKPLSGDLTVDGTMMYVGTTDGLIHAVSTVSGGDVQQISFPATFNLCNNVSYTCQPDLVAVQP
jgi:trimeric autotransporter adhesin